MYSVYFEFVQAEISQFRDRNATYKTLKHCMLRLVIHGLRWVLQDPNYKSPYCHHCCPFINGLLKTVPQRRFLSKYLSGVYVGFCLVSSENRRTSEFVVTTEYKQKSQENPLFRYL